METHSVLDHGPLARYAKLRVVHVLGMLGMFSPPVRDPGMHHSTCVTYMWWCMMGLLICSGGENVPSIPGTCIIHNFLYLATGPWKSFDLNRKLLTPNLDSCIWDKHPKFYMYQYWTLSIHDLHMFHGWSTRPHNCISHTIVTYYNNVHSKLCW